MTKRESFEAIVSVLDGVSDTESLVEFVLHEIELLDKRSSAERKPSPKDIENDALKSEIVEMLAGREMNATEIATATGKSVQKVSQLMRQLVDNDSVIRIEGKGKIKTVWTAV